jgi:hypothetical protein
MRQSLNRRNIGMHNMEEEDACFIMVPFFIIINLIIVFLFCQLKGSFPSEQLFPPATA